MKGWLRRFRGAIGNGLTWAVGWGLVGALTGWFMNILVGPVHGIVAGLAQTFGVLGFLGGFLFSGVLGFTEAHGRFDRLSLPRFTAWGALGGLLLGGISGGVGLMIAGPATRWAVMVVGATLLGAGSAAGTLALARAGIGPRTLPEHPEDEHARLTVENQHQLLGKAR